jgi:hypothetical protein
MRTLATSQTRSARREPADSERGVYGKLTWRF